MSKALRGKTGQQDDDHIQMNDLRIALLEQIGESGSITQAARAVGVSYKTAWDAVDAMKNLSDEPLVESGSGGKGGGGTVLTEAGKRLVRACRLLRQDHARLLAAMREGEQDFDKYYQVIRRLSMKSSARNQFFGKVVVVREGAVNDEIEISLKGDDRIVAIITSESRRNLDLAVGSEAWALVKSSWVILATDDNDFKLSVRNRLCGTISRLTPGAVNSEVIVTLPGGNTVCAIVTNGSVAEMGLKEGGKVCALFKASSVIVGVAN